MREIVPEQIWQDLANDRGQTASLEPCLYNDIFRVHYLQAFDDFCERYGLLQPPVSSSSETFDSDQYIKDQLARRSALNLFIRRKAPVVVFEGRFFIIAFISEIELRIDELTPQEMADIANASSQTPSILDRLKFRLGVRRLRGKIPRRRAEHPPSTA